MALGKIVQYFGEEWLEHSGEEHPLQKLWKRKDGLSGSELLILGDSLSKAESLNPQRVKVLVERVKSPEENTYRGAVYEIIAAAIFQVPEKHEVEFAPGETTRVYDLILKLKNGNRIYLSVKNLGKIMRSEEFQSKSKEIESIIAQHVKKGHLLNVSVVKDKKVRDARYDKLYPELHEWGCLRDDLPEILRSHPKPKSESDYSKKELECGWTVFQKEAVEFSEPFLDKGIEGQVHNKKGSYNFLLFAPLHKFDPQTFFRKLEEQGIIGKYTDPDKLSELGLLENDKTLNAIFIRVPSYITLETCDNLIRDYFERDENLSTQLSLIILYQPIVVGVSIWETTIAHCYRIVSRRERIKGLNFQGLNLGCLFAIGTMHKGTPPIKIGNVIVTNDLDNYFYQSGNIYLQRKGDKIYKAFVEGMLVETLDKDSNELDIGYPFPLSNNLLLI